MSAIVVILPSRPRLRPIRDADFYEQRLRERAARRRDRETAPPRTRPLLVPGSYKRGVGR